jgi:hypothetical protein
VGSRFALAWRTSVIKNIQKVFDRVDHVVAGIAELRTAFVSEVARSGAVLKPEPGKDRSVAKFVLRMDKELNLDRLGLPFGELIHHLRSALDNLVVATALHLLPHLPENDLKPLSFIIATTEAEWNASKGKLKSLPSAYIDEIRRMQPFNGFGTFKDRSENLLVLLRDLDNSDKHYLQAAPSTNQLSGALDFSLEFQDDAAAERAGPPRITIRDTRFESGANIFDVEVSEPIKDITGKYNVEAELIVENDGIKYNALSILLQLAWIVQVVIDCIQAVEDPECRTFRVLRKA